MRIGSLFAGIGGFDLAARWMGWDTAWVSEIEPYAASILRRHWPNAPNHGDIRRIDGRAVERVDVLCGGFPCQDISLAGKGVGIGGERSGLWKEYARLIDEIRPRYVVAENVAALRTRGLDVVLQDLHALGYDAEWHCIPASYVGAPHRRDRIWIIAYPHASSIGREGIDGRRAAEQPSDFREDVPDADRAGLREQRWPITDAAKLTAAERGGWWAVEPNVGRVAHGIPARVDRLRCLGNAIVPQVALLIFQAIARREAIATSSS